MSVGPEAVNAVVSSHSDKAPLQEASAGTTGLPVKNLRLLPRAESQSEIIRSSDLSWAPVLGARLLSVLGPRSLSSDPLGDG